MPVVTNPYRFRPTTFEIVADFNTTSSSLVATTSNDGTSYSWTTINSSWKQASGEAYCYDQTGGGLGTQGGQVYLDTGVSDAFHIRHVFGFIQGSNNARAGAMFNMSDTNNYAKVYYRRVSGGYLYLDQTVGGTWGTLGSYSVGIVAGDFIDIYRYADHAVEVYLNDGASPIITGSLTDSNIQAATAHGMWSIYATNDSSGTHYCDQWEFKTL